MTTSEAPVAVVEGPKGKAEIYEIFGDGRNLEYQVKCNDKVETYKSLGEAYIEAGQMVGTKT
ncbi:MAG TPA: hypothetical protein VNN21_11425 [Dehalococcoidia bacterium]|nr:hypothetical protein [Dehalococcoidia bacterium]